MRKLMGITATLVMIAATLVATAGSASADPSASAWKALRQCESGDRYTINTGNGYYGAYQFDLPTWKGVGGTGRPDQASAADQDYRALRLYRLRGWAPWICAALVGLTEDADGGSGKLPPVPGGVSPGAGSGGAPASGSTGGSSSGGSSSAPPATGSTAVPKWPGATFKEGYYGAWLAQWQKQMGKMGYGLTGTGYFGPKTTAAVLALQRKAGLNVVGYIGPKTWAAAWNTAYKKAGATVTTPKPTTPKPATPAVPAYVPATDATCHVGSATAPAFKGTTFTYGNTYRDLQCFQRQLGHKGYGLTGTGYFGAATKAALASLQKRNGLPATGKIGAAEWKAAWQGA